MDYMFAAPILKSGLHRIPPFYLTFYIHPIKLRKDKTYLIINANLNKKGADMNRPMITLAILFTVIASVSLAVLPPEAYEELREDAPVVVTGEVVDDTMLKDTRYGEVWQFELEITEVERGELNAGDVVKVEYFIPDEEPAGPGGIRGVTIGGTYKLWLQPTVDDGVYEGAAYMESIEAGE